MNQKLFLLLYGRQKTQEQFKKFSKAESKDNRDYKLRPRNPRKHFTIKRLICLSGEICSAEKKKKGFQVLCSTFILTGINSVLYFRVILEDRAIAKLYILAI